MKHKTMWNVHNLASFLHLHPCFWVQNGLLLWLKVLSSFVNCLLFQCWWMYSVQNTFYTVYSEVYSVQCIAFIVQCTMYSIHVPSLTTGLLLGARWILGMFPYQRMWLNFVDIRAIKFGFGRPCCSRRRFSSGRTASVFPQSAGMKGKTQSGKTEMNQHTSPFLQNAS